MPDRRGIDVETAAQALHAAWLTRVPIDPLSLSPNEITPQAAYAIQERLLQLLQGDDAKPPVGYKLGLTSRPMQELLKVDQPDYALILDSMVVSSGGRIVRSDFIQPKIEAEIAVVLAEPLRGPAITPEDVLAAATGVAAALEVIDLRIRNWQISLVDTIADVASGARVVVSPNVIPIEGFEPRLTGMTIWRNDDLVATGAGAAVMGDPLRAVAWLANKLSEYGQGLEAGRFVMTGSLHAAFDINGGDDIVARFDRLGDVRVKVE